MQPCPTPLKVLSLGWGVQSWTLAAMSALGELPLLDIAIHSDTTWEHEHTYQFAERWTPWLEAHDIPVLTARSPEARALVDRWGGVMIPAYTINAEGKKGQVRRQCTKHWKIMPMRRELSWLLKELGQTKRPGIIESWIGISLDEFMRMKDSGVKYITNRFPLVELEMSRQDCLTWLAAHDLPSPGKSSCVFCPYQNKAAWEALQRAHGKDWETAVAMDAEVRRARPPDPLYVHRACCPLPDAVVAPEPAGKMEDFEKSLCDSGACFL